MPRILVIYQHEDWGIVKAFNNCLARIGNVTHFCNAMGIMSELNSDTPPDVVVVYGSGKSDAILTRLAESVYLRRKKVKLLFIYTKSAPFFARNTDKNRALFFEDPCRARSDFVYTQVQNLLT